MIPSERLDAAESAFDAMNMDPTDLNYVPLQSLIAIGRYLQVIVNKPGETAL